MVVRSPMIADVGARIRALRTARGLTQAQVAQPSYTKAYISMLESGRTRASMKALEHIAGVLGVQPSDLLGGQAVPDAPQYQLVRLRYLATAYNADGHPKQAFPIIERAQKMAELLGDRSEQIRILAVLSSADIRTSAYDEGLKLLRECIAACESGALNDPPFLFRRFVDLGLAYSAQRQPKQALASFKRALAIGEQFALRRSLAGVYAGMAASHHELGDLELAIRFSQRSLDIYEGLGLLDRVACVLDNVALLYTEYGNRARARCSSGRPRWRWRPRTTVPSPRSRRRRPRSWPRPIRRPPSNRRSRRSPSHARWACSRLRSAISCSSASSGSRRRRRSRDVRSGMPARSLRSGHRTCCEWSTTAGRARPRRLVMARKRCGWLGARRMRARAREWTSARGPAPSATPVARLR